MFYSKIDNHQVKKLILTGKPPKKKVKKLHTLCELSQKIRDPPPIISQQFQPLLELKNRCFCFLQLLRVCE